VGVTCAKTLAHLLGWQAIGVPSLEVAAQNVDAARFGVTAICPLRDARRRFVYGTVFEWRDGRWSDRTGVLRGEPKDVAARIPAGALVFGSGVEAYAEVFRGSAEAPSAFRAAAPELDVGKAEHVARLGLRMLRERGPVPPMELVARYYRRTEAEEKLEARNLKRET
jgi:tRNA A37 threonylcarbamoyladenosine modification protein TsaB